MSAVSRSSTTTRSPWRSRRAVLSASICLLLALLPTPAAAHVKWFEEAQRYPMQPSLVWTDRTALLLAACSVALVGLAGLRRLWPIFETWSPVSRLAPFTPALLRTTTAVALVGAAFSSSVLAPQFNPVSRPLALSLGVLQVLIAGALIGRRGGRLGCALLLGLAPVISSTWSPWDVLEQAGWWGIAVFGLLHELRPADRHTGLGTLRVLTGIAIVAAALGEKVWNPALGLSFLAHHPGFNVAQTVAGGQGLTDDSFVLMVGVLEAVLGVLVARGCLIRPLALVSMSMFVAGIPFLPPAELLGHLPIVATMLLLASRGPGSIASDAVLTAQWVIDAVSSGMPVAAQRAELHWPTAQNR